MAANPRAAAVAALVRQEQAGFSNLVLDAELKRQQLEGRDKAFASAIFYTVLEHQGTLDHILCQFLPKGLAKLDAPVREILRAALAQARYMQVPVSAAVNEAVKLTRTFKKSSASGLVNAVLRKACSYDLSTASFKNEVERLMVLGSAGRDVAEFLHKNYPDEALDILTYKADGGMTSLRANPLKGSADELCAKLLASGAKEAKRGIVPGSVLARFEGSPAENELFRQGYFHVEGQASQLAALCVDAQPGETVIDLCAAPGGKVFLCHAGDSRAYLYRDGRLAQLTHDHSYVQELVDCGTITVEEAEHHPQKNIITKALGVDYRLDPEFTTAPLQKGDILLLCSDGLTNAVPREQLEQLLRTGGFYDLPDLLIRTANENGGPDNITALLLRVEEVR